MNKFKRIFIISRHEFLTIAARKSFIVMTILLPLLMLAFLSMPYLMMKFNTGDTELVGVIDESGRYGRALADGEDFRFQDITPVGTEALREFYEQQEGMYAVVVIPADVDSTLRVNVYSKNAVRSRLQEVVADALGDTITQARINSYQIPQLNQIIEQSQARVSLNCVKWDESGNEAQSDADLASLIGLVLALLTYGFVLSYGGMVLGSVIEEKTNRIVEVMTSCCKPIELLLGKIIGVGFVGVAQMLVWSVFFGIVAAIFGIGSVLSSPTDVEALAATSGMDSEMLAEIMQPLASINFGAIGLCFILYFIGGYLLYGSMFAAAGSMVDQPSDSNQATMPLIMFLVIALWAGMACAENPDGQLAWWCSMIPFTSPVVMMVRLPYDVALWEIVLSIGVLFASALGISALAARIYRRGILMYGKKFSWMGMIKGIRN